MFVKDVAQQFVINVALMDLRMMYARFVIVLVFCERKRIIDIMANCSSN